MNYFDKMVFNTRGGSVKEFAVFFLISLSIFFCLIAGFLTAGFLLVGLVIWELPGLSFWFGMYRGSLAVSLILAVWWLFDKGENGGWDEWHR